MTDPGTSPITSHHRPVGFIALRGLRHPVHPVQLPDGSYIVAYDVTAGADHTLAAWVMHHLIGDFNDITSPAEDITQLIGLAVRTSTSPRKLARTLQVAIIDAVDTADPWAGKDTWPAADQASNETFSTATHLIEEAFKRHVEASEDPRAAAEAIRSGLLASVRLVAAGHFGEEA